MIYECTNLCRNPRHTRNVAHTLKKAIHRSLLVNSRRQAEKAAEEIGACLEPEMGNPDLQGAHPVLKRWYRHMSTREPNPSQEDMVKVKEDYAMLYRREEPTPSREIGTNPQPTL